MPRISGTAGPSHADLAKETATLVKQGKLDTGQTKLNEWNNWKVSLCGSAHIADVWRSRLAWTSARRAGLRARPRHKPLRLRTLVVASRERIRAQIRGRRQIRKGAGNCQGPA